MSNWNIVEINNKFYLIKYENTNNIEFKCILSDLGTTWKEEISANDLLARAKEINPAVEVEFDDLVNTIFRPNQLLADMYLDAVTDQNNRKLSIKFKLDGYTLKFNWNLAKSSPMDSSNDLTVSLICSLVKLKKQNNDLIDIIGSKDEEIEQHKFDGATLTREKLITPKFDNRTFQESANQLHSKSNEFDEILANIDSTKLLLKLCNVDYSMVAISNHGKVKYTEQKPAEGSEPKKKSATLKKRKLAKKQHLPNRGPLNYGIDSDTSDDVTSIIDDDDCKDNNQKIRLQQKPTVGPRKRVQF